MERVARVLVKIKEDLLEEEEKPDVWAMALKQGFPQNTSYWGLEIDMEFIEWEPEEDDGN